MNKEWVLNLEDNEWPLTAINHDRKIVRAIAVDDKENSSIFVAAQTQPSSRRSNKTHRKLT